LHNSLLDAFVGQQNVKYGKLTKLLNWTHQKNWYCHTHIPLRWLLKCNVPFAAAEFMIHTHLAVVLLFL